MMALMMAMAAVMTTVTAAVICTTVAVMMTVTAAVICSNCGYGSLRWPKLVFFLAPTKALKSYG